MNALISPSSQSSFQRMTFLSKSRTHSSIALGTINPIWAKEPKKMTIDDHSVLFSTVSKQHHYNSLNEASSSSSPSSLLPPPPPSSSLEKHKNRSLKRRKKIKKRKKKKSVRFNLNANKEYNDDNGKIREDCKSFWYSSVDFKWFRHSNRCEARRINQVEFIHNMNNSNRSSFSYRAVVDQTYRMCYEAKNNNNEYDDDDGSSSSRFLNHYYMSIMEQLQQHLAEWIKMDSIHIGLEKLAVQNVVGEKVYQRTELIRFLRRVQKENEDVSIFQTTDRSRKNLERDEFIRRTCESITRPSRIFAEVMGRAHALTVTAAVLEDDSSKENQILFASSKSPSRFVHAWASLMPYE